MFKHLFLNDLANWKECFDLSLLMMNPRQAAVLHPVERRHDSWPRGRLRRAVMIAESEVCYESAFYYWVWTIIQNPRVSIHWIHTRRTQKTTLKSLHKWYVNHKKVESMEDDIWIGYIKNVYYNIINFAKWWYQLLKI